MKLRKKVPPLVTVKSDSIGFPPQDFRPRISAPGFPPQDFRPQDFCPRCRYCRIPSALLSPTCVSFTSISASIFWL